jgi:hypothetical protein
MIIVRITGGIGNQLFQYALGYTLGKRLKKQVSFDVSFYQKAGTNGTTKRDLEIKAFNIGNFNTTSGGGIKTDVYSKIIRLTRKLFLPYYKRYYIHEHDEQLRFDSNIFKISDNTYLDGFWHSPQYFEGFETEIRNQLVLKHELSKSSVAIDKLIANANNSVSVHIRRGDYLTIYKHFFCNLDNDYYTNGISYIKEDIGHGDITLFIFSDDIAWCREHFNCSDKVVFVENKGSASYEDMILMSHCNHNIIANSSYSWWAAWLNLNPGKNVIYPKDWFTNKNLNRDYTNDIALPEWVAL